MGGTTPFSFGVAPSFLIVLPQNRVLTSNIPALKLTSKTVFINSVASVNFCKGKYSKKYHYRSNCRGLFNCSTGIYKVTKLRAKELNRILCG